MKKSSPVREMFDNCTAARVRMSVWLVSNIYDQAMARHDVTVAQTNLIIGIAEFAPSGHEMVQVYGSTLKALVHEQFGDGIISAVNLKLDIKKVEDPEGGLRTVITADGKFLPFKPFQKCLVKPTIEMMRHNCEISPAARTLLTRAARVSFASGFASALCVAGSLAMAIASGVWILSGRRDDPRARRSG
jgi:hypothetical protein